MEVSIIINRLIQYHKEMSKKISVLVKALGDFKGR